MRPTVKLNAPAANLSGLHTRYMNPGELDKLCHLINHYASRFINDAFLEIGTNSGRTSLAVLRNCPNINMAWGIDVAMSYQYLKPVQRMETPRRPGEVGLEDSRYKCLLARNGTFDIKPADLPEFDVVFIDGDHSERAIRNDRRLAYAVGAKIIIYHDDNGMDTVDVSRTLDDFYKTDGARIVHVEDSWLAYEVTA